MKRNASDRMPDYLLAGSSNAERAARFRRQMADFARGDRLRRLREARHLSQEDAAHEIGVSVKTVRSWEKGGGIKWDNAKSAGSFYEVNPESLVTRELPVEQTPDDLLRTIDRKLTRLLEAAGLDTESERVTQAAEEVALAASQEPQAPSETGRREPSTGERRRAAG